ncbi:MAG TPA: hypothetical protein VFH31_10470 [Pyrinomonadaceae bacterium]|nr:hypothetical protein [Pyrinomonadaceae bacterium]
MESPARDARRPTLASGSPQWLKSWHTPQREVNSSQQQHQSLPEGNQADERSLPDDYGEVVTVKKIWGKERKNGFIASFFVIGLIYIPKVIHP